MPGGNTRAVLHYDPFPLTMTAGQGAELTDLDGHHYVDFVCEFSSGLFGHSDEILNDASNEAMVKGIVTGSPYGCGRPAWRLLYDRCDLN